MFRSRTPIAGLLLIITATPAAAIELDGFTEPYRTISVAADETGIVADVLVREGETVDDGQPMALLNSDVHLALLAIAEKNMLAGGRVEAASAELQLRRQRLEKLLPLARDGHARQEEVDKARAEISVAAANLRSAREDLLVKRLEYQRIQAQLARRTVRSPMAGVVTALHKQKGEFVAANNPDILTLVVLDPLLAHFSMTRHAADRLEDGQEVKLNFSESGREAVGKVEFISPVTDAESGTVHVKVRVENAAGLHRSGERCTLRLPN